MQRDQALSEIERLLRSVQVEDNAKQARDVCLKALRESKWVCTTEVKVPHRGDGRRGYVDIEAQKGGCIVGIEIDRSTPRHKSVVKLNNRKDWLRVIATRGPMSRKLAGVDLYVPLNLKA